MVNNPLLKYSVEALLHEANPLGEPFFRKTHFFKSLFLLHDSLKKKGLDIELPYCWYLHGPLVEQKTFEALTGTKLENYLNLDSTVRINNVFCDGVTDTDQRIILDEIIKIVKKYHVGDRWEGGYIERLVGDAYKKAPYPYQNTFKREYLPFFNDLLNDSRLFDLAYDSVSKNLFKYLDILIKQFPKSGLVEIFDEYLQWDDEIRLKIEIKAPIQNIYLFSKNYWNFFCLPLRIEKNENVLPEVIEWWEHDFKQKKPEYVKILDFEHEQSLQSYSRKTGDPLDSDIDIMVSKLMGIARDKFTNS